MNKIIKHLMVVIIITLLTSCITTTTPSSASSTGPRTIILNDVALTEENADGFTSWYCLDFVRPGSILVEVGFFGSPKLNGFGFILYEGGYTGELTHYKRTGVEHRWDWGPNENDFAFVIQPDGTGLYYDFTKAPKGTTTKASSVYKCYRR